MIFHIIQDEMLFDPQITDMLQQRKQDQQQLMQKEEEQRQRLARQQLDSHAEQRHHLQTLQRNLHDRQRALDAQILKQQQGVGQRHELGGHQLDSNTDQHHPLPVDTQEQQHVGSTKQRHYIQNRAQDLVIKEPPLGTTFPLATEPGLKDVQHQTHYLPENLTSYDSKFTGNAVIADQLQRMPQDSMVAERLFSNQPGHIETGISQEQQHFMPTGISSIPDHMQLGSQQVCPENAPVSENTPVNYLHRMPDATMPVQSSQNAPVSENTPVHHLHGMPDATIAPGDHPNNSLTAAIGGVSTQQLRIREYQLQLLGKRRQSQNALQEAQARLQQRRLKLLQQYPEMKLPDYTPYEPPRAVTTNVIYSPAEKELGPVLISSADQYSIGDQYKPGPQPGLGYPFAPLEDNSRPQNQSQTEENLRAEINHQPDNYIDDQPQLLPHDHINTEGARARLHQPLSGPPEVPTSSYMASPEHMPLVSEATDLNGSHTAMQQSVLQDLSSRMPRSMTEEQQLTSLPEASPAVTTAAQTTTESPVPSVTISGNQTNFVAFLKQQRERLEQQNKEHQERIKEKQQQLRDQVQLQMEQYRPMPRTRTDQSTISGDQSIAVSSTANLQGFPAGASTLGGDRAELTPKSQPQVVSQLSESPNLQLTPLATPTMHRGGLGLHIQGPPMQFTDTTTATIYRSGTAPPGDEHIITDTHQSGYDAVLMTSSSGHIPMHDDRDPSGYEYQSHHQYHHPPPPVTPWAMSALTEGLQPHELSTIIEVDTPRTERKPMFSGAGATQASPNSDYLSSSTQAIPLHQPRQLDLEFDGIGNQRLLSRDEDRDSSSVHGSHLVNDNIRFQNLLQGAQRDMSRLLDDTPERTSITPDVSKIKEPRLPLTTEPTIPAYQSQVESTSLQSPISAGMERYHESYQQDIGSVRLPGQSQQVPMYDPQRTAQMQPPHWMTGTGLNFHGVHAESSRETAFTAESLQTLTERIPFQKDEDFGSEFQSSPQSFQITRTQPGTRDSVIGSRTPQLRPDIVGTETSASQNPFGSSSYSMQHRPELNIDDSAQGIDAAAVSKNISGTPGQDASDRRGTARESVGGTERLIDGVPLYAEDVGRGVMSYPASKVRFECYME